MIYCSNPFVQYDGNKEEIIDAVKRVFESGEYVLGSEVATFEKSFAEYCGVQHGVGVNSGTDALILTLCALDIGAGDEVITVSHTAIATIAAIISCGATPVLVDIESDYFTMDSECFKQAITDKTKAVIPVHLYGQPVDMDSILLIAKEHDLFVIEDCAQAPGATYKGKRVGSMGDAGCFSFYPTKNLGAIGDAGMVVTENPKLSSRVRQLGQYGWNENRDTQEPGINSRLDELQAAILNVKLKSLDLGNARRKSIAVLYGDMFSDSAFSLPMERPNVNHVYHLYVISGNNLDALKKNMKDNGVATGIHYPVPGHLHRGYNQKCLLPKGGLPVTENLVGNILSLPMYPEISSEQLEMIFNSTVFK
jgi:dTDP-4-amino-4,6-dideoxygalactose transaminase